jgi:hypothetical protein
VTRACGSILPTVVPVVVLDAAAQILAGYTQVSVQRSTSTSTGPWTEITTDRTRTTLVTRATLYDFIDDAGSSLYWYRWAPYNPATHVTGAWSTPVHGIEDSCLEVISIQELKDFYLFGVNLTDDNNTPYPESLFLHYIRSAVSWLEGKIDISIRRTTVLGERHDYERESANQWMFTTLWRGPVISVEAVKLVLPGEQLMRTVPKSWIHVQRDSGQLQIVPGGASTPMGALWAPLWSRWTNIGRAIPDMIRVDYTAGFGKAPEGSYDWDILGPEPDSVSHPDPEVDELPGVIKDCVGKTAAFGPLNIAGDLIVGAGIASQSLSIDGISQSIGTTSSATNAGYGARLIQYRQELKDQVPYLIKKYRGIRGMVA